MKHRISQILAIAIVAVALTSQTGCKDSAEAPPSSGCAPNHAMIGVKDGYLSVLCGCDEPSGSFKSDGQPLTCTVPNNTFVIFDFSATVLFHQVVPIGTPALTASPVRNPSAEHPIVSHVFQPTAASATYQFQDGFQPGLSGRIITR